MRSSAFSHADPGDYRRPAPTLIVETGAMTIEKELVIDDPELVNLFWRFYHEVFDPLNERTPLSQTLDREMFERWMASPQAIKFFVRSRGVIKGLAILSSDLSHDPLISQPFFAKQYPGRRICHIPVLCISEEFRRINPMLCAEMVQLMADEVRESQALSIFFHSRSANPAMPRLIRRASGGGFAVTETDAMACIFIEWNQNA